MPVKREQQDKKIVRVNRQTTQVNTFFIEHFRVTDSGYMECFELRFIFRI